MGGEPPPKATTIAQLTEWFPLLGAELAAVIGAFTDDDLENSVTRAPHGFQMPVEMQLEIYLQAVLIFSGKATIYFRAMGKPLPPSVLEWIG